MRGSCSRSRPRCACRCGSRRCGRRAGVRVHASQRGSPARSACSSRPRACGSDTGGRSPSRITCSSRSCADNGTREYLQQRAWQIGSSDAQSICGSDSSAYLSTALPSLTTGRSASRRWPRRARAGGAARRPREAARPTRSGSRPAPSRSRRDRPVQPRFDRLVQEQAERVFQPIALAHATRSPAAARAARRRTCRSAPAPAGRPRGAARARVGHEKRAAEARVLAAMRCAHRGVVGRSAARCSSTNSAWSAARNPSRPWWMMSPTPPWLIATAGSPRRQRLERGDAERLLARSAGRTATSARAPS